MRDPIFDLSIACGDADVRAAQRLRYRVFVEEMGGDGPLVDHQDRREIDRFDAHARHLVLRDLARSEGERVVGVYRLMTSECAAAAGGFYTEAEYDVAPLAATGRRLLEVGRSCLHPDYRGGTAMRHLWAGLADHAAREKAEILFGVASFHGTDLDRLAAPLSMLHHRHLAPPALRPVARAGGAQPMDLVPEAGIDRVATMRAVPALIKAYLRLGGMVGEGAWIDRAFNTTDVCLVLDAGRLSASGAAYLRASP